MERNVLPVTMRLALGNDDADIHTCKHIPHQHAAHNPHQHGTHSHPQEGWFSIDLSLPLFAVLCSARKVKAA